MRLLITSLLAILTLSKTRGDTSSDHLVDLIVPWILTIRANNDAQVLAELKTIDNKVIDKLLTNSTAMTRKDVEASLPESEFQRLIRDLWNQVTRKISLAKPFLRYAIERENVSMKISKYEFQPYPPVNIKTNEFYWDTKRQWSLIVTPFTALSLISILIVGGWVRYQIAPVPLPAHTPLSALR